MALPNLQIFRNKRGFEAFVLEYGLPFIFLILVIALYTNLSQKISEHKEIVGEKAFTIINSDTQLKNIEFKYHELGRYTLYNTLHKFAADGGLTSTDNCGNLGGTSKWTKYVKDKKELTECYPEKFLLNLNKYYGQELTAALSPILPQLSLKHEFKADFNLDNQQLTLQGTVPQQAIINNNLGKLTTSIQLDIALPYNIAIYGNLIQISKVIINKCQTQEEENLPNCISNLLSSFNTKNSLNLLYSDTARPRTKKFELTDKQQLPVFINNKFNLKPLTYKFILDIPEPKLKIQLKPGQDTIIAGSQALFLLTFDNQPEKFNGFTDGSMIAYLEKRQGNEFKRIEGGVLALGELTLDKNSQAYIIPFNTFEQGNFILVIKILKEFRNIPEFKADEEYKSQAFNVAAAEQ